MPTPDRPRLPPNQQLVRADRWPVVGEKSPGQIDPAAPWLVEIDGLVESPQAWTVEQLRTMPGVERTVDIHCVTRWSKYDVTFAGLRLCELLDLAKPQAGARYVSFIAQSERNHSTSLPLEEVMRLDPLVAFAADGQPLTTEHGGPVRVVAPGKYFYKSVKWLRKIELLAEDRLGYWEQDTGYHNGADPWLEQRFVASNLTLQQARRVIEARDFTGLDLLSIEAAGLELQGLKAERALLRNANFTGANLRRADFRGANLSNAKLTGADCREADFTGADLEGVDLTAADLRGAKLAGASFFGASFAQVEPDGSATNAAQFDESTQIEAQSLAALTDQQRAIIDGFRGPGSEIRD